MSTSKIYKLKLDHNCGEMFAIIDDLTNVSEFDGRVVSVFLLDRLRKSVKIKSDQKDSVLGPFLLYKMPSKRSNKNWEFIENSDCLYSSIPNTKETNNKLMGQPDWSGVSKWYINGDVYDEFNNIKFFEYEEVRRLESQILQTPNGICIKATMFQLIKSGKDVWEYYDIKDLGNRNLFEELINTYFQQNKVVELLKDYPETFIY
jgi:hypothetical protein